MRHRAGTLRQTAFPILSEDTTVQIHVVNFIICAFADSLKVMWACLAILVPSLDGGPSAKKHAAPCRPKELSALTKSQVAASLTGFVSTYLS